jgi:hypothetical protein
MASAPAFFAASAGTLIGLLFVDASTRDQDRPRP